MTLRAWLDTQPYGAQALMSRQIGFHRVYIGRVAGGKDTGSPFFWSVVSDYTKGAVA